MTAPALTADQLKALAPEIAREMIAQFRAAGGRGDFAALLGAKSEAPRALSREDKLLRFSKWVGAIASAGDKAPLAKVREALGRVPEFADIAKGMQESSFTAGGAMLVPELSGDVIEFLRPESVLLQLGAKVENFKGEKIIRKRTGGTTAYWLAEGALGTESAPTFGQVKLQPHKLMVLTDISNDLIRNPEAGDLGLAEDIVSEISDKFDKAGMRGSGASGEPTGVVLQVNSANKFNKTGTAASNYIADLDKAVRLTKDANIPFRSPGWVLTPTQEAALLGLTHTNGSWVFRDEMLMRGTLRGYPYKVTTNWDSTRICFGLWGHLYYGVDTALELSQHPDLRAKYDETTVRGVMRGDFRVRHDKAFSLIETYS